MKTLKTALIALSTLALSSAAMAHGWERPRYEGRWERRAELREARYELRHEDRYAGRYGYAPVCAAPARVAYVQPRVVVAAPVVLEPRVNLQARVAPGVHVGLSFGL